MLYPIIIIICIRDRLPLESTKLENKVSEEEDEIFVGMRNDF